MAVAPMLYLRFGFFLMSACTKVLFVPPDLVLTVRL
jgi:hypothetical protein